LRNAVGRAQDSFVRDEVECDEGKHREKQGETDSRCPFHAL
jgi:hypothetical protein